MPSKTYFAYIRVSTLRQGQHGTSLDEQRAAIARHAERSGFEIIEEFTEKETAAKQGRPVFSRMLELLRRGKASGVIMHKIDRSARNLKDWAAIGELIDSGVEIHFANESLDLHSRGGRLSADIQAVIASDFIRNLREETKKGFYGRIKQGVYPRPAPVGYLDCGAGRVKQPDPVMAPLVRQAFDFYATARWTLDRLVEEMAAAGLRGKRGRRVTRNGLWKMLRNPFYTGVIPVKIRGEVFPGGHRPIVPRQLFDRVQDVLDGKKAKKGHKHLMVYRRLLKCAACSVTLIGEVQKGQVYYRCHTRGCPQKTVTEAVIDQATAEVLREISFTAEENRWLRDQLRGVWQQVTGLQSARMQSWQAQLAAIHERLGKMADAYVDGVLDRETYLDRKNSLVVEEQVLKETLARSDEGEKAVLRRVEDFLELVNDAYLSWNSGSREQRAEFVQILASNLVVEGKTVVIKLNNPFRIIKNRDLIPAGRAPHDVPRTLPAVLSQLREYFAAHYLIRENGNVLWKATPKLTKAA